MSNDSKLTKNAILHFREANKGLIDAESRSRLSDRHQKLSELTMRQIPIDHNLPFHADWYDEMERIENTYRQIAHNQL